MSRLNRDPFVHPREKHDGRCMAFSCSKSWRRRPSLNTAFCAAAPLAPWPTATCFAGSQTMGRYAKVSSILFRTDLFQAHLENWELILQERTVEAIERIASVPGVAGVILGGSVGRGMAWPISDIDLIYITTRGADNSLPKRVDELALSITREWAQSGFARFVGAGLLYAIVLVILYSVTRNDLFKLRLFISLAETASWISARL